MIVSTPVTSHAHSNHPGAPTCRLMSADTIKMPEPIIEPATIIVESSKPRPRTKPVALSVVVASEAGMRFSWFDDSKLSGDARLCHDWPALQRETRPIAGEAPTDRSGEYKEENAPLRMLRRAYAWGSAVASRCSRHLASGRGCRARRRPGGRRVCGREPALARSACRRP